MKKARMLGNYTEYLATQRGLDVSHLSTLLSCTENQVQAFYKGRSFPSFNQLSELSEVLGTTPSALLTGDEKIYNETVVHCMNAFDNPENRENILDIIDDYMDIYNAVYCQ